jgi:hypothetical protein
MMGISIAHEGLLSVIMDTDVQRLDYVQAKYGDVLKYGTSRSTEVLYHNIIPYILMRYQNNHILMRYKNNHLLH